MAGKLIHPRQTTTRHPAAVSRPFAYRPGKTILHRVPAGIKLICMMALSVAACSAHYGLAASILLVTVFSFIVRIPLRELFRGSKTLIVISLFVLLLKTFTGEPQTLHFPLLIPRSPLIYGFTDGLITVMRIFTPFAAASLFFAVTTMRELRLSVTAMVTGTFRRKVPASSFSLGISLMMGFIPRFFDLWEMSNIACDVRSCKRGPRRLLILIPLVIERMMEAAADTALAVEARGFGN